MSLSPDFWFSGRTLDWCARGHGFEARWSHTWCQKCWLVCTPKHGGQGWYDIVDSMANGVGLPDLLIGWEVTCDVLSIRLPGSREKGEECGAVLPLSLSPDFWLSGRTLNWCVRGRGFETQRSHNIVTHSICYSHCYHKHNTQQHSGVSNRHRLRNVTCKQTFSYSPELERQGETYLK